LICTAPIDSFFDYILGKLKYRSLNFQFETLDAEQFQSSSVINYAEESVPYTRITEFKHFYGTESRKTTIMREIATWDGQPMYPVPMKEAKELYGRYQKLAENQQRVRFAGRLGVYKYLDIDTACKEALELAEKMIQEEGNALPKGT
jgi:UDP-galactopyranose mutase